MDKSMHGICTVYTVYTVYRVYTVYTVYGISHQLSYALSSYLSYFSLERERESRERYRERGYGCDNLSH